MGRVVCGQVVLLAFLDLELTVGGDATGIDLPVEAGGLVVLAFEVEGLLAPHLVHHLQSLHQPGVGFGQVAGLATKHCFVLPRTGSDAEEVSVLEQPRGVADLNRECRRIVQGHDVRHGRETHALGDLRCRDDQQLGVRNVLPCLHAVLADHEVAVAELVACGCQHQRVLEGVLVPAPGAHVRGVENAAFHW
jgi:hypothetical protein